MGNTKQETNYVHLALEIKASANFRIHRIIHSTLSATNLYGICRLPYAILGSQYLRFSVYQNFLRFHNWAAEFRWRKYNNHVDWCYYQFMVSKLSKPLSNSIFCWSAPSATSHSSSSKFQLWSQGTYTVTYLLQAFISEFGFKDQSVRGHQACTLSSPHTHKPYRCLTSTHPLFSELEDNYLLFSRLIPPDIPLFLIMPPEFLLELSP